jgi:hypothetical protein
VADLKTMTVRGLRALARKHFGPGISKFRSKNELVAALSEALARPLKEALESAPPAAERALPSDGPSAAAPSGRRIPAPGECAPTEPDPEGHLVARVAGERAAHASELPLVEEKVPPSGPREPHGFDERLGDLPDVYGEDAVVLLAKDPRSLYLYWDFSRETLERAFAWMPGLHTKVRLYAGGDLEREVDFALEARSWYFHDLSPGRAYQAELTSHAIDGQVRRIGEPSNLVKLPTEGLSPVVDDRFLRIPWEVPPPVFADAVRRAEPAREEPPAAEGLELEPPVPLAPFAEDARLALFLRSGGTGRALGSSEIAQLAEALGPNAALPPPEGAAVSPAPETFAQAESLFHPHPELRPLAASPVRALPWSASIPPWSGTLPRR